MIVIFTLSNYAFDSYLMVLAVPCFTFVIASQCFMEYVHGSAVILPKNFFILKH